MWCRYEREGVNKCPAGGRKILSTDLRIDEKGKLMYFSSQYNHVSKTDSKK